MELEQTVLDACIAWLGDEKRLIDPSNLNAEVIHPKQVLAQAQDRIKRLQDSNTQNETLLEFVQKITVHRNRLEIQIAADHEVAALIEVPIQIKRSGLAVKLIVGNDTARPRIDRKLLALINKGLRWFELLESGKCDSLAAIALTEDVGSSYVSRVMNLAFLSPDILQIIAGGRQPEHLTADRLMRMGMPPVRWTEQWKWLGMLEPR